MARLNARWSRFWATSKTYKHFWQSFPVIGSGPGAIVTVTTTISTAGLVNVSALGSTLTDTITLIGGHANVSAEGDTLEIDLTLIDGVASVDAHVVGAVLEVDLFLTPGVASEFAPGTAEGATVTVGVNVIAGRAEGGFVRVTGGMPYGPSTPQRVQVVNATAQGATITLLAFALPGVATGIDAKHKVVRAAPVVTEIVPISRVHVTASGQQVVRQLMIEAGKASGDAIAYGQLVEGQRDWGPYDDDIMMLVLA